jgi:hypothetical protein
MHSHQGVQEAFLLAALLIVHDAADETGGCPLSVGLQLHSAEGDLKWPDFGDELLFFGAKVHPSPSFVGIVHQVGNLI